MRRTARTCRRDRARWFLRVLNFLGLRGRRKRCDDFYLEELPPDIGVREPRRPHPSAPGGATLLELPHTDFGWNP
jgi:hypothetical protein